MTPEEIQAIMPEGYGGDWELTCQVDDKRITKLQAELEEL